MGFVHVLVHRVACGVGIAQDGGDRSGCRHHRLRDDPDGDVRRRIEGPGDVPGVRLDPFEDAIAELEGAEAALAGATVLLNLSGSPITVGRAEDRKLYARSASSRCSASQARTVSR